MIDELIERVRGLTGPDREVDALIAAHFHVKQITGTWPDWCIDPPFTASLDAAVALVERVLPGWGFYLRSDKEGHGCGLVYPDAFRVTPCHCMGATPAIAVILALLSALKAKEARDGR